MRYWRRYWILSVFFIYQCKTPSQDELLFKQSKRSDVISREVSSKTMRSFVPLSFKILNHDNKTADGFKKTARIVDEWQKLNVFLLELNYFKDIIFQKPKVQSSIAKLNQSILVKDSLSYRYLPSVSMQGSLSKKNASGLDGSLSLDFSYLLHRLLLSNEYDERQAWELLAAVEDLKTTILHEIIMEASDLVQLRSARLRYKAQEEKRERARADHNLARQRLTLGMLKSHDFLSSKVRYIDANRKTLRAQVDIAVAEEKLWHYRSRIDEYSLQIYVDQIFDRMKKHFLFEYKPEDLLIESPILRAQYSRLLAMERKHAIDRSTRSFEGSLNFGLGVLSSFDPQAMAQTFGRAMASVSIPLFTHDSFISTGQEELRHQAMILIDQSIDLKHTLQKTILDRDYVLASLEALKEELDIARANYQQTREAFAQGLATWSVLLEQDNTLGQLKMEQIDLEDQLIHSNFNLFRHSGGKVDITSYVDQKHLPLFQEGDFGYENQVGLLQASYKQNVENVK